MTDEINGREKLFLRTLAYRIATIQSINTSPSPKPPKYPNLKFDKFGDLDAVSQELKWDYDRVLKNYTEKVLERSNGFSLLNAIAKDMGVDTKDIETPEHYRQLKQKMLGLCMKELKPETTKTAIENISNKVRTDDK